MKRIRYIPGAISLVLLLPLTQWKVAKDREPRIENCLSIEFLGNDPEVDGIPARNWTVVKLTDRPDEHLKQIRQFKDRIHKLKADLDTTQGVVLSIPPDLSYQTFIDALEFADNDSVGSLVVKEKEIRWFFRGNEKVIAPLPEQIEFDIECGNLENDLITDRYVPITYWESQRPPERFRYSLSPIWFLWLALVTLSIVRLRRQSAPT